MHYRLLFFLFCYAVVGDDLFCCHLYSIHTEKFEDEMVRNSTTACATAKPFAPMCSPRGRDYQKNSGLLI